MNYCFIDTAISRLLLLAENSKLRRISFYSAETAGIELGADWIEDISTFTSIIEQLQEYVAGKRQKFAVDFVLSGTAFQQEVWSKLLEIPYGQTSSYQEIAGALGRPNAARAVGSACRLNPLPLIIPCHRVIGSSGKLTGFAGGLTIKERLLQLEQQSNQNVHAKYNNNKKLPSPENQ